MASKHKRLPTNVPGDFFVDSDCIDCGTCEFACPVNAIYNEDDLPADLVKWVAINAERSVAPDVVNITETQEPLPTANARKAELGL